METQNQRPFVWLACGSALGVCFGELMDAKPWIFIVLFIFFGIGLFCYLKWATGFYGLLLIGSCFLFLIRFSYVDGANQSQLGSIVKEEERYVVQGEILSSPKIDGDRLAFDLALRQILHETDTYDLKEERIRVSVRLLQKKDQEFGRQFIRGDQIRLKMQFIRPQPARNPGGFDYKQFLYRQQIHWLGEVESVKQIEWIQRSKWNVLVNLDRLRQKFANQITRIYPTHVEGYIRGLILGERDQVNPQVEEAYAAFGITHVLSISGLHISILVSLLFFLLKSMGLARERAAIIVLLLLPCYVLLTGAEPPVVRAGIMAALFMLAIYLNQWKDALSFLAIAFLLQLGWNPYLLFTASFQFTFIITAALIIGVPPIIERLSGSWLRLKQAVVVALIAQFASFPIAIRFFYEFPFLSWLANLLFVPLISILVLPGSMLAVAVSLLNFNWGVHLANLTTLILELIHQGMEWISPLYLPVRTWQPPSLWWILIYSGSLIYLWFSIIQEGRNRALHRVIASAFMIGVLFWVSFPIDDWGTNTRVTFVDVGQGDCILIETEQGQTILVDGGGTPHFEQEEWRKRRDPFEVGKDVVVPFLKYRGVQRIDTLIMTHGDADHIGGLKAVISRFPVKRVIRNPLPPHSNVEQALLRQLADQKVPIYTAPVGEMHQLEEGVGWQFLHPVVDEGTNNEESTNNDSVVVLFSIYGHQLLLTGDIEKEAEDQLLERWNLPSVDVMKVAHHGSETSTQERWLQQLAPKEAIISVGRKNRFGHPTLSVIQRLQKVQARIWRTDQHGAITISFAPDRYTIEPVISNTRLLETKNWR